MLLKLILGRYNINFRIQSSLLSHSLKQVSFTGSAGRFLQMDLIQPMISAQFDTQFFYQLKDYALTKKSNHLDFIW